MAFTPSSHSSPLNLGSEGDRIAAAACLFDDILPGLV
jgi:hypothetical protein